MFNVAHLGGVLLKPTETMCEVMPVCYTMTVNEDSNGGVQTASYHSQYGFKVPSALLTQTETKQKHIVDSAKRLLFGEGVSMRHFESDFCFLYLEVDSH